jgi:hypothetical protein
LGGILYFHKIKDRETLCRLHNDNDLNTADRMEEWLKEYLPSKRETLSSNPSTANPPQKINKINTAENNSRLTKLF